MELHRLKIELMHQGVRLTESAARILPKGKLNQLVYRDYPTTGGLVIEISRNFFANCAIDFNNRSLYTINWEAGEYLLSGKGVQQKVEIHPPPRFALENIKLPSGHPVRTMVMSHADRARISPIFGCDFNCGFCDSPQLPYRKNPISLLDASFKIAIEDDLLTPRHVLISGGTPKKTPTDYQYMNDVYRYFPEKYPDLEFDLMLAPRPKLPGSHTPRNYLNYTNFLKEIKVAGLSINLELYDDSLRKRFIPEKEEIGLDDYLIFIEKAVESFGPGRVRSCLVVGLESIEKTLSGVEAIAKRGAMPVLSPFIPAAGTLLASRESPHPDFLERLLLESTEIADKYNVELGPKCRPCRHNNLSI